MGNDSIAINLSCSHGNANIAKKDFVALFSFTPEDAIKDKHSNQGAWMASRIEFHPVLLGNFDEAEEPTEAYAAAVQERLLNVAAFLDRQEAAAFEQFRRARMHVYIHIGLYMNENQMQLSLPVAFLSSCTRLGLGLEIISND